jgi:hypothetical protein
MPIETPSSIALMDTRLSTNSDPKDNIALPHVHEYSGGEASRSENYTSDGTQYGYFMDEPEVPVETPRERRGESVWYVDAAHYLYT